MRASELGGDFMIADISDEGVKALGLDGSRIPKWLLPGVDEEGTEEWSKHRPDILLIKNMPSAMATRYNEGPVDKEGFVIYIIEVGYTRDYRFEEKYSVKHGQHSALRDKLLERGWKIPQVPPLVFGSCGTQYITTVNAFKDIYVKGERKDKTLRKIQRDTMESLSNIIATRRRLEREDQIFDDNG